MIYIYIYIYTYIYIYIYIYIYTGWMSDCAGAASISKTVARADDIKRSSLDGFFVGSFGLLVGVFVVVCSFVWRCCNGPNCSWIVCLIIFVYVHMSFGWFMFFVCWVVFCQMLFVILFVFCCVVDGLCGI